MRPTELRHRVDALEQAEARSRPHLPPEARAVARATVARVRERLARDAAHTVVGILGPTGVGKSSLFNALIGREVAPTSIVRPTTNDAQAFVFGDPADDLLDWMGVPHRTVGDPPFGWAGMILIDLPDIDSVETAHRQKVDEVVEYLDLMLWVVDTEKYADDTVHQRYLRQLRDHHASILVAVNKADLIPPELRLETADRLTGMLRSDGQRGVHPHVVSARTGEGVKELRELLSQQVRGGGAVLTTLSSDVALAAETLQPDMTPVTVRADDRVRLRAAVEKDALVDVPIDAATRTAVRQGDRITAWPPLQGLLAETDQHAAMQVAHDITGQDFSRTLARFGRRLTDSVGEPWAGPLRRAVQSSGDGLATAMAEIRTSLSEPGGQPEWRRVVARAQTVVLTVTILAALAAVVLAVIGPDGLTLGERAVTLPSARPAATIALLGVFTGLALDGLSRLAGRVTVARRRQLQTERCHRAVDEALDATVFAAVDRMLEDRRAVNRLAAEAAGRPQG